MSPATGDDAVAAARAKARRRLVGAAVLLAAAVIGFPLLFETEPRPLPPNLPIVTAQGERVRAAPGPGDAAEPRDDVRSSGDGAPPPPAPATSGPALRAEAAAPLAAGSGAAAGPQATAASGPPKPPAAPAEPAASVNVPRAASPGTASPQRPPARAAAERAPAPVAVAPERAAKPTAPTGGPAAEGRFVVQVGAYADQATLRETRQQVEKLGLKTYTQVVDSDAGRRTRVRVGPFDTRAEAQAAAAKLKAAGLPAALLTL